MMQKMSFSSFLIYHAPKIQHLEIPFLHINHLIANKKAVNRPKDQLDVTYVEKIKKLREDEGL